MQRRIKGHIATNDSCQARSAHEEKEHCKLSAVTGMSKNIAYASPPAFSMTAEHVLLNPMESTAPTKKAATIPAVRKMNSNTNKQDSLQMKNIHYSHALITCSIT